MTNRFSFIFDRQSDARERAENSVVAQTARFAALPSLGSLVPGWLLVVPKRPVLNCSMLSEDERIEISEFATQLSAELMHFNGNVFAFEHGSTRHGSPSGCGVDQAHLHIVPLPFDLITAVTRRDAGQWIVSEGTSISEAIPTPDADEYIVIYDFVHRASVITYPRIPTSQWVRRVIAEELQRNDAWDYKQHTGEHEIAATLEFFNSNCGR